MMGLAVFFGGIIAFLSILTIVDGIEYRRQMRERKN